MSRKTGSRRSRTPSQGGEKGGEAQEGKTQRQWHNGGYRWCSVRWHTISKQEHYMADHETD